MKIVLYKTVDPINKLNKALSSKLELIGNLKNDCDIMRPVIEVSYFTNWKEYNYCYIEEFGRYYFIDDVVFSNKLLQISMSVDVLMSFKNDILNSYATITRSNRKNINISDPLYQKGSAAHKIITRKLGKSLETSAAGTYLVQIGG